MANIGIIVLSAKPYHAGHDALVRMAAAENDSVHLYVSLADRARRGEAIVLGGDMEKLWKDTIEGSLPSNVAVTYGSGSPMTNAYEELIEADKDGSLDTFTIYGDEFDLPTCFSNTQLEKHAKNLMDAGQVNLRAVSRSQTVDVSGTEMRRHLMMGDKGAFLAGLPAGIDGELVWNTLAARVARPTLPKREKKQKTEGLVKEYMSLVVQKNKRR